jgi:hypothetical protein
MPQILSEAYNRVNIANCHYLCKINSDDCHYCLRKKSNCLERKPLAGQSQSFPLTRLPMKKSKATEALRVATDIAAIKAALHKRGYRLRKQPKQPVWKVIITPDYFYTLTYQPAPISAWVLHPQNNDTRYQTIEAIIQHAIKKQPANLNRTAGR